MSPPPLNASSRSLRARTCILLGWLVGGPGLAGEEEKVVEKRDHPERAKVGMERGGGGGGLSLLLLFSENGHVSCLNGWISFP